MSAKYTFTLKGQDRKRDLPRKIIVGQHDTETTAHVLLKLFGFLLFHRDRLQLDTNLHQDQIPFIPHLVQLDYELRPQLWVECGDCSVSKLNKLAVKVPEAEIWVIKKSETEVDHLYRAMEKEELRRDRYSLIALDESQFSEVQGLLRERNEIFWVKGSFEPPEMHFDFNGLWFEIPFVVRRF